MFVSNEESAPALKFGWKSGLVAALRVRRTNLANEQAQPLPPMGAGNIMMNLALLSTNFLTQHIALDPPPIRSVTALHETTDGGSGSPILATTSVLLPPTTVVTDPKLVTQPGSAASSQPSHALMQSKLPFMHICKLPSVTPPSQHSLPTKVCSTAESTNAADMEVIRPQTQINAGQAPMTCDTVIAAGTPPSQQQLQVEPGVSSSLACPIMAALSDSESEHPNQITAAPYALPRPSEILVESVLQVHDINEDIELEQHMLDLHIADNPYASDLTSVPNSDVLNGNKTEGDLNAEFSTGAADEKKAFGNPWDRRWWSEVSGADMAGQRVQNVTGEATGQDKQEQDWNASVL
ncbi:hypothetical protein V8E55_012068 [Tylopilus felleus]